MPISKETAALWDRANRRNAARIGLGDRADALHKVVTIPQLIRSIGTNPAALELLAARSHELTDAQRTAVLEAYNAPNEARKASKAAKPAMPAPGARRGIADVPLRGFNRGAGQ